MQLLMPFMNEIESTGPSMLPCGTPLITGAIPDKKEPTLTWRVLSDKKLLFQRNSKGTCHNVLILQAVYYVLQSQMFLHNPSTQYESHTCRLPLFVYCSDITLYVCIDIIFVSNHMYLYSL